MSTPVLCRTVFLLFLSFAVVLIFSWCSVGNGASVVEARQHRFQTPSKLFVFGDSYADTGNTNKSLTSAWKVPYGITFPGVPSGRYSDGRVLTDYIARFLGIKSPVPHKVMNSGPKRIQHGVNFAYGGTGVFQTASSDPNMTTQIDFMQQIVNKRVYSSDDLLGSVALVTLSGNDYAYFISKNSSAQALMEFIPTVVNQLVVNIQRVKAMGVKKVIVTSLQPLGCLPRITILTSFKSCNEAQNSAVQFHNLFLQQAVAKLNNGTQGPPPYIILDLYTSFMSILQNNSTKPESVKFKNLLKLCCAGTSNVTVCGSTSANGEKLYTVCDDPQSSFFWDTVHPSQEGWRTVSLGLQTTLEKNLV